MRRQLWISLFVGFLGIFPLTRAAPPAGYYNSVEASSGTTLRATLHEVIDDHQRFPYTSTAIDTWDILEQADENPTDPAAILDVYKNTSFPKFGGGGGGYNREHTWPSSYGFPNDNSRNYPYSDCHHLFLSDQGYNSSRSNNIYSQCNAACAEKPTAFNGGVGGGTGVYPGQSNWRSTDGWETWIESRGDVARALFYLDTRYEGGVHGTTGFSEPDLILTDDANLITTTGGNAGTAYMGLLSVLIQWHLQDPVDAAEQARNDLIYSYQQNRNPFIDHPEWVGCLYADVCSSIGGPLSSELGIYSESHTQSMLSYARIINSADFAGNVTNTNEQNLAIPPFDGIYVLSADYTDSGKTSGGFIFEFVAGRDVSDYQTLKFALDSSQMPGYATLEVKPEDGDIGAESGVLLSNYTPTMSGNWAIYEIPLTDFADFNPSNFTLLGFWNPQASGGQLTFGTLYFDDIHFAIAPPPDPLSLSINYSPPAGTMSQAYYWDALVAAGGQPPYTFSVLSGGPLTWSLTLQNAPWDNSIGTIWGYPDSPTAGTQSLTLQVTDANTNTATVNTQIKINFSSGNLCCMCHTNTGF